MKVVIKKRYVKIFVFLLLPMLISGLWLFSPFDKIYLEDFSQSTDQNNTRYVILEDDLLKPSLKNSIRDLFNAPFNLRWYNLCIEDKGSYGVYGDVISKDEFEIWLSFNDGSKISVTSTKSKECKLVKVNSEFKAVRNTIVTGDVDETIMAVARGEEYAFRFVHRLEYYIVPNLPSLIVKNILFLISWVGTVLLLKKFYGLMV